MSQLIPTATRLTRVMLTGLVLAALLSPALSPSVVPAQEDLLGGLNLGKKGQADPVQIEATLTRENSGAPAILAVTVRLPKEHYIRSTTDESSVRTKFKLVVPPDLEPIDSEFVPDRAPKSYFDPLLKSQIEKFDETVTWFRRFRVAKGAEAADVTISGQMSGQYCGPTECVPLIPARKFEATLTTAVPLHRLPAAFTKGSEAAENDSHAANGDKDAARLPFELTERPKIVGKPGPAELTVSLSPEQAAAGATVRLSIKMTLDGDYHTYSTTMPEGQSAIPTKLLVGPSAGLRAVSEFTSVRPPEKKSTDLGGGKSLNHEVHHGEVEWTQEFTVTSEGARDGYGLFGKLIYQTCTGSNCLPPKPFVFALGAVPGDAMKLAEGLKPPKAAKRPAGVAAANPPAPANEPAAAGVPGADQGLFAFLGAAVVAGFLALLTPCVFPMVPITVSFFLKQSESKHHRPLPMALLYCGGIIGTFTILGILMAALFGATSLTTLANNPWLNVALAGVMVFFGFNLLGMFEIRVPYQLLTWTSGHEGKGGVAGVLFMALTFTLVSFTCTFAFCGLLLALAAKGQYWWPIIGMLAFSAAFSSPFFFLALFPSLLKKIPKSGGWMNTVKVTMGMLELGAALKFLSVADLAWNPAPVLFDYTMTMLGWLVISVATAAYLLGLFRFPHDTKAESISVVRFSAAMLFLVLGGFLGVGLFAPKEPGGKLWEYVKAFAPARLEAGGDEDLGPYVVHNGLKFALDFDRAIAVARKENRPLFFDFTGVNCTNCRLMEGRMALPQNHERLENFVRAAIFLDSIPGVAADDVAEKLLEKNQNYASKQLGDVTMPSYAVLTPDGKFLETFKGLETRDGEFTRFLDKGLERWSKVAGVPLPKELSRNDRVGPTIDIGRIPFALDLERAKQFAADRGKPVLAYVNGINDANCRLADKRLASMPDRDNRLGRFVPAILFVDSIPNIDDEWEHNRLIEANQKFAGETLGDIATPTLAVLSADGVVVAKYSGIEVKRGDYGQFLDEAWNRWQAQRDAVSLRSR